MAPAPGGGWLATWPGTAWTLRFDGRAIGVTLDDAHNHWVLEVDGEPRLQIAPTAGERTVWLRGLPAGRHEARLVKRTESPRQAARVLGFEVQGRVLPPPAPAARRIEFIGDSFTAAMGNLSPTRACAEADIPALTDVTQSYAVRAARSLGAEARIHAVSGQGLVRNWAGNQRDSHHGLHYARLLQDRPGAPDAAWVPTAVVIALGINDFSTPVADGEPRDAATLMRDVLQTYRALLADVHRRAGDVPVLLLSTALPSNGDKLRPLVRQLADEQRVAGWRRTATLDWGPITARGCGGHPDLDDHRHMSARVVQALRALD
ncbi:GDSL-type esterase/lipase family protein [Roseateles asaccharophilus]|uniref:Lysophospholipase L1-like esterase n=2 Tax=Roseateles asaccharophilus TaxID=582607 RepID=A0ABU2ABZ1_9BURK|nr:GDSL-type esterase/lipase family protein [Roseateles asaccharophilus]MDR7334520.1 lysophospholipase L1-like esterase [Roseateles asaccharophilus]